MPGGRAGGRGVRQDVDRVRAGRPATLADVALMRATVGPSVQVKAAGGVRTLDVLLEFASAGVTRFGATATATILDDLAHRQRHGTPVPTTSATSGY